MILPSALKAYFDDKQFKWECYDFRYNTIKKNIQHIFRELDFTCNSETLQNNGIFESIRFLQKQFLSKKTWIIYIFFT